jgi:hypothetical protein
MSIEQRADRADKRRETRAGRTINRRGFLKLGAAGLAGVGLLGTAACGEGGGSSKANLRWSMWADTPQERKVWEDLAKAVTETYPNI